MFREYVSRNNLHPVVVTAYYILTQSVVITKLLFLTNYRAMSVSLTVDRYSTEQESAKFITLMLYKTQSFAHLHQTAATTHVTKFSTSIFHILSDRRQRKFIKAQD